MKKFFVVGLSDVDKKQKGGNDIYSGFEDLQSSENALISYNKYVVSQFMKFSGYQDSTLGNKPKFKTLDFGAGVGSLALLWSEMSGLTVDCFEIDPRQLTIVRNRGFNGTDKLEDFTKDYDLVYTSNVLEHIEDDQESLDKLASLLKPNGRIAIYVPAFNVLFSELDRSVGHYRRYGKRELKRKVHASGFKIIHCRYVDSVGFFASIVIKILGWKGIGNIGGRKSLVFYDRFIFPISQILDVITAGKVLGKNLILIAEKS